MRFAILHLVHNPTRLFGSGKHAARFDQEGASRRCQIDMSCRPDEQRRTEFVLRRPDRCGQTGLDDMQPERRPGEILFRRDRKSVRAVSDPWSSSNSPEFVLDLSRIYHWTDWIRGPICAVIEATTVRNARWHTATLSRSGNLAEPTCI